jgi:ribosome hibernation promoting factor
MTENRQIVVEVKARHGQVSARMQEHAFKKVARLVRYNDRVVRIEIIADHPQEDPEVEMLVHMRRGAPLVAKERGGSFSATVDGLVEKMEKQLKRQKEKRKDHKSPNGRAPAGPPAESGERREDTYEDIVRRELKE